MKIDKNEVISVLNSLKVQKIGMRDVIPGIRMSGTYNPRDIVNYSEKTAQKVIPEIRDEQGLSSLYVLTEDGISMEVCPRGKHVVMLSHFDSEREIQNRLEKSKYDVIIPRDKGDYL